MATRTQRSTIDAAMVDIWSGVSRGDRLLLLGSLGDEARLEGVIAMLCAPAL